MGLTVADVPAGAATDTKPSATRRIDPREVPVMASKRAPDRPAKVGNADFTPLEKNTGATHFDATRSIVVSRSMFTDEFRNPDGTHTVRQSVEPLNAKDANGTWQPVDTTLRKDAASGRVQPGIHPLKPSLAGKGDDPAVLAVNLPTGKVSLGFDGARPVAAKVDGNRASYPDIAPDADLDYEVTAGAVKETVVLKRPPARARWRFRLSAPGLTPALDRQDGTGSVLLKDAAGKVPASIPPVQTWDSAADAAAMTGGHYAIERSGDSWLLTVSVDNGWLRDPKRVYPVSVDPTITLVTGETHDYRSDGYACDYCGLRIGNSLSNGDSYNRAWFFIDYSSLWGKNVVGARLDVTRNTDVAGSLKTWGAGLYHATGSHFDALGTYLAGGLVGDVGSFSSTTFTTFMRDQVNARNLNVAFMMTGTEQPGTWTYKNLNATLTVDTGTPAPAPALQLPADNSVLTTMTPTLSVSPVSDPDGDPVTYCFRVATGADAQSGVVVDSGCLGTPQWTVPLDVLQDGVAYTWQAMAYSGSTTTTPPWVGHFKVDQRIGEHGPSPVDSAGPVTVNLANGNVNTSAGSPSFTTVGGNAGLTFGYNSQQRENKGLRASYFVDLSHNGIINPAQQPVLVRTEPQVNVSWGTDSPFAPALPGDWFVARWEGYFQAPATGTYQFAGVHDDGAEVYVNGNKVYDGDTASDLNWTQATNVSLTLGQRVPIKVELQEATGAATMRLFTRTTEGNVGAQIVPADWLYSSDLPALPQGWTLSADLDGDGGSYTKAQVTDQNIVLTDTTGAKHTWTKKSTGGYDPPAGEDGVLAVDSAGRVTLQEGNEVFTFRPDGALDTQSTTADSRKPAALQNIYDGAPLRLSGIKDPVSGRLHVLHYNRPGDDCYGGVVPPAGADALPPAQMLCRVSYWDGTETRLWYTQGRLSRIEDPGSEITDFGYTADGLLNRSRSPLVDDWIAADPAHRTNLTDIQAEIAYDTWAGKPTVTSVTSPAPAPGQPRPRHAYRYDPANRQTSVDVAGLNPAPGYFSKVTYDDADRLLSTTDATGRTTGQTWNVKDQLLTSTDAAGRVSATVYDYADRVTDKYGPASASCFSGQQPTAACAATVPHTHTNYDENVKGLSVAYYANPTLNGSPNVYATGIGTGDGTLVRNWGTDAPTTGITTDSFSLRATGEISFPQAGDYVLRALADDGVRVWIDDTSVIDDWKDTGAIWREGIVHVDTPGTVKRIRVDYYDAGGNAQLELHWKTPGGVLEPVPTLRPRYGLTTSSVTSESDGVADETTATRYNDGGLDPVFGLPTATVTDPAGHQLTTWSGYEPPGTGYLRETGKTMPDGVPDTYAFYGDTETRANPCVPGSPAVNQGGMAKLSTTATPASGTARVDEQVYDASGRIVAKATTGDWTCTSYDGRGRVSQVAAPASVTSAPRTVHYDYQVGGDPLTTSVRDNHGTVTTTVDLLGRTVTYTDVHGTKTETGYDQAGRASAEKVTPPNAGDAPQTTTPAYDDAGRVLTTKLGGTVLATSTYDTAGELATVSYANGSSLAAIGKDTAGRTTALTWKTSDGHQIAAAVARTRAGTITDETLGGVDARPNAPNYVYDTAGRLTEAWVTGHHHNYDFTSLASSACPGGTRSNAGTNTNRVRLLDQTAAGTAETGYCYDSADRLLATTGAATVTGVQYNAHGDTTEYTAGGAVTKLAWDGADRNTYASTTGPDPAVVAYTRDATDRIVWRNATQGDQTTDVLYGYTGSGDSADLAYAPDKHLLSRSIALPGGVLYTINGSTVTWDHPTIRGDLSLTTDNGGKQVGELRTYTPFGEPVKGDGTPDSDNVPDNQPGQMDNGWLGRHQRPYEHAGSLSLVQMGARPYSPLVGRFLSVDPVEGGSANDYDYTAGDPVNKTDLDGKSCRRTLFGRTCTSVRFHGLLRFTIRTVHHFWGGLRVVRDSDYHLGRHFGGPGGWVLDSEITCTYFHSKKPLSCSIYQPRAYKIKRNWACFGGVLGTAGAIIGAAASIPASGGATAAAFFIAGGFQAVGSILSSC
ncbi:PA14 domain-containing protein [Amycolatopsis mediterranei]|uniref:PA14 domain-containing protein n=1 Tax=Amycolatopsis mediterranei TaxID=33910 RepID=UPI003428F1F2